MGFDAIFTRMTARILKHASASDVLLRGEVTDPPRDIAIEHGVELTDDHGQLVEVRSVATISSVDSPRSGDALEAGGKTYLLDAQLQADGFSERWSLVIEA